jgi:hypothetical protein
MQTWLRRPGAAPTEKNANLKVSNGRVPASDEDESGQGGEGDGSAQNVQHVHVCRLGFSGFENCYRMK